MLRSSVDKLQEADRRLADYSYARFNVRRELTSDGKLKAEHTVLARREFEDGFGFILQVQRDGKAIPEAELRQSHESARARAAQLRSMSPADRQRANQDVEVRAQGQTWLKEFPDALQYKQVGEELIAGRKTMILECSPRPGYKASNLKARVFEKVYGRIWMDVAEREIVRVDAVVADTVSVGWGLVGQVQKGTRFQLDRRRLPDGSWLPESQSIRFAARIFIFKSLAQEEITRYSEYKHKSTLAAAN